MKIFYLNNPASNGGKGAKYFSKIETTPQKLLTPDGQLMGSTPIEVECLPKAIEVFTK